MEAWNPQGRLIKRTSKAEVYHLPDNSVVKRYVVHNAELRVEQDQRSLLCIQETFGDVRHDGWLYRTVKPLWFDVDRGLIYMEFVSGSVLSEMPKWRINDSEYHCGIWLALYHKKMFADNVEGMIYSDFTTNNIIVDFEKNIVTAVDPGFAWGRFGYVYEDLVRHIFSVIMTFFIKKVSVLTIVRFLKGYMHVTKRKLNLLFYYKGLYRELRRQLLDYAKKSSRKCLIFCTLIAALSPLYLLFIPGYMLLHRTLSIRKGPFT